MSKRRLTLKESLAAAEELGRRSAELKIKEMERQNKCRCDLPDYDEKLKQLNKVNKFVQEIEKKVLELKDKNKNNDKK